MTPSGALALLAAALLLQPQKSAAVFFDVRPETWYHLSARIATRGIDRNATVNLRYRDAAGKVLRTESGLSCWRADAPAVRYHRVVKSPPGAARCEAVAANCGSRGEAEIDEIRLDDSVADARDETSGTRVLNGSFEEADLAADFVDCWTAAKGTVRRTADAAHGFHALTLSAGAELCYARPDARALAVTGGETLHAHVAAKGRGAAVLELKFDAGQPFVRRLAGGQGWRADDFDVAVPAAARFAALRILSEGEVSVDALYLGSAPYVAAALGAAVPADEPVAVGRAPMPRSSVRPFQGVPTWFVGEEPVVNSLYTCRPKPNAERHTLNYHRKVIETGQFPIYVIGGRVNADDTGPGSLEEFVAQIDFEVRFILGVKPDARFLVWYQQYPTAAFARDYPDELAKVEDEDQGFVADIPGYSYGSEIWSRQCERSVRRFFRTVCARDYGARIVGFMPGFGNYGENNFEHFTGKYYRSPHDFSPAMANFFRKWLLGAYGGDAAAFGAAWARDGFNFAHAQAPTTLQRVPRLAGAFLDPKRQRQVVDYARCESFAILHRVERQCRVAKEMTDSRVFTCSQIGYLSGTHNHREMGPILESPWLDAFGPAPGYTNRGPGDDIPAFAPVASLRHHNKVYLFQSDVRSHITKDVTKRFGDTDSPAESVGVYLREIGKYMTQALVPYHWTFQKWYDDPEILKVVARFDGLMRLSARFPRGSTAEVAVVLDPLSLSAGIEYNYNRAPNTAGAHFMLNTRLDWHRLGAPYDLWLFDDLLASPELSRYRLVVLPAQVALTSAQREAVRTRLCRDGRTVVWMFAPGVMRSEGTELDFSPAFADVCGFRLTEQRRDAKLLMTPELGALRRELGMASVADELGWPKTGIYGGFSYPWNHDRPQPLPVEVFPARFTTADGTALARWADDGTPAAAIRRLKDFTSVFWGSTMLDRDVFAALATAAGVHLYVDRPAVVYANGNFCVVHVKEGGPLTVRLPRRVETVVDLVTGETLASEADAFVRDFAPKSTLLFYFGDRDALEKAWAVDFGTRSCDNVKAKK